MKILFFARGALAVGAALLVLAGPPASIAQEPPVVSARPGQRTPQALPAPAEDGIRLSIDQAVTLALANNPDLNVTVNAAEASRFFLFQNTGIYDPILTANTTRAHSDDPVSSSLQTGGAEAQKIDTVDADLGVSQLTPWGGIFDVGINGNRTKTNSTFFFVNPSLTANLFVNISQPLLRNFGRRATEIRIDTARNARDASYQDFVRSVQRTVDSVEQAYWDLVFTYGNLKVKQEAKNLAIELNRITRIKIDVGSLAPIDIVQTEVDIAVAEQEIINAEGALGLAQDQLKRLLNFDTQTWNAVPIVPTDSIRADKQSFDLAEGVKTALARRPEIIAQNYSVASDSLLYEYYQNQTLPQLNLIAGYGKNGLAGRSLDENGNVIANGNWFSAADQLFSENFKDWRVGLAFSYPLGNRAARGARGVAKYNLETSKARLTVLEQDIVVAVRNAHRQIETASRQIDAAAKARELAERNLDAARKKYDNGMTTSFEVSQITNDLSDARSLELNALVVYRKAVSAYHNAIADILDWKNVRIEGLPEMAAPPQDLSAADLARRTALVSGGAR